MLVRKLFRYRFKESRDETIWLTSYADIMTNLTLVFLALYGLTVMGDSALREAFLSMDLEELKQENIRVKSDIEVISTSLKGQFQENPNIQITEDINAVRISFGEKVLFQSGQANLISSAKPALREVSNLLSLLPYSVIVEGHTDSVPIKMGTQHKDNWDLSLARAMSVVQVLIEDGNMDPRQIAAAAYGSVKPRASNLTASGRRINRRVEISLLKDFPYKTDADIQG